MTAPRPHPAGKSNPTPDQPHAAEPAAPQTTVSEPKGVARQGVVTALRPDRFRRDQPSHDADDPTSERPGIRIYAPPVYRDHYDRARWSTRYASTPTAACACGCGYADSAMGARQVARLVDLWDLHRSTCTGTPAPHEEGRAAA
ncbi:hypothetical protein [Streptomyces sp. NPDC050560]|uniref:hypothetical protein n=1 Tax=Streptomyces sp. NPDC050560 TaxID=3365630 RepID=UPI003793324F